MKQRKEITVKQHYIPQFYFRNFSEDQKRIYQINLKEITSSKLVPIESICFKKNLYELRDDNDEYIHRNMIENKLSEFEGILSSLISSISHRSKVPQNYKTKCFLTSKEKQQLIFFLALLICRNDKMINVAKEMSEDAFKGLLSRNKSHNFAIITCLPFGNTTDESRRNLFDEAKKLFNNLSFQLFVADCDLFFTSDFPLVLHGENQPSPKLDKVIFPLSSKIVLVMKPKEKTKKECMNCLVRPDKKDIVDFNCEIIRHSHKWLYSKKPFTDKMIEWIRLVMEDENNALF